MNIGRAATRLVGCVALLAVMTALATDRTWSGGAGTTVINTAGNWSGGAAPTGGADTAIWDGTVQTNVPYVWNAYFGPGSGNNGPSYSIGAGHTLPFVLYNSSGNSGNLLAVSNITIAAGAGPFTLGSNGWVSPTVFRANGTNRFVNNSTMVATVAENVTFANGGGADRMLLLFGNWVFNSALSGSAKIGLVIDGSGANVTTLNAASAYNNLPANSYINNGTLVLANGDALGVAGGSSGPTSLTIGGGGGQKTLALTNNITLNSSVVANIYLTGRNGTNGVADAAIYNLGGDNSLNGRVVFNASGGTNVELYIPSGSLSLNGAVTCANVTGNRYINFLGAGTTYVNGVISNGSATANIVLADGKLVLNNANTFTGNAILNSGVLTLGNNYAMAASTAQVNGGLLDLNGGYGLSPSIGGLSGTGVVDTLSGGAPILSVGSSNVSSTFSGNITNSSGAVSLQKIGTGTFTLAGASGYSGGTTVANGTLLVNSTVGSGTGSGDVVVNSGATLGGSGIIQGNVNWQTAALALFTLNPISGSNATPLTVSGSLTLNGNAVTVNVPGSTPLGPGTYKLVTYKSSGSSGAFVATAPTYTGAGVQLGTASSIATSGGAVTLTVVLSGVSATWTNDADGNWTTAADWSSNPNYPHLVGDAATLGAGSAYRTVTLDANVSLGTLILTNANSFSVADAGKTMTFANTAGAASINVFAGLSNAISTAITLNTNLTLSMVSGSSLALTNTIKNGGGTQAMNVSGAGTVVLAGNNTYGPAAGSVGTILSGGSVLELANNNAAGAGDVSVAGSSTVRAGSALTLANNLIAGSGATATVDNNGNNVTLAGVVSGGGGLAKNGVGTLLLGTANTYANGLSINAGTLKLGNAGAIPSGAGYGNVSMGPGATLDLSGYSVVLNGLSSSDASATVGAWSGGNVTLTLGENGANATYSGILQNSAGSLALVKDGTGTQTLAGTNNITAGTTINAGTLQLGNGNTNATGVGMAVGLGTGPVVNNGVLQFNLAGTNIFANDISGSGGVNLNNRGIYNLTGNNTFTGGITNNGAWLWINQASKLGTGPKTLQSTGRPGQIHLDGSSGDLNIDSSYTFLLSGDNGVVVNEAGSNTISGELRMTGGAGNPYLVVSNGFLTLAGQVSTVANAAGARTLTLGGSQNGLVSGTIIDGELTSSVTKTDAGTWTLSADNNYSGQTTVNNGTLILSGNSTGNGALVVNGGTLLVNGNNYGMGAVTVGANGTLGGTGSIFSAVTWQAGAKGAFTLTPSGGANATPLTVYGNVALNANNLTIYIPGSTPLAAGTYVLLNEGSVGLSSLSGSFAATATITGAGLASGTRGFVTTTASAATLTVVNSSTWTQNANGNWTTGANWDSNPNYPSAAGQFATFGIGSSLITVNVDASQTIGGMSFTNANSFVISSAANSLTLNNNGYGASISVTGGNSNSIATALSLAEGTTVTLDAGTALSIPGSVSGSSGFSLTGDGRLTLSGANSYSGDTTMNLGTNGGTLVLDSTTALGTGTLTIAGGTLDSSVANLVNGNANPQVWNGSFVFQGSQNLNLGAGTVSLGNNLTLAVKTNTLVVGGDISGGHTLTFGAANLVNNGTLELDGNNSFSGLTVVSGTVALGNDNALGSAAPIQLSPGNVTPAATNLTIMSKDATPHTIANGVSVNNYDGPYILGGTGDLSFSGTIATGNGYKRFYVINKTTFSGPVTDNGAPSGPIAKDGPGTLVLSADNSATTKQFRLDSGTLALGSSTAIGTGALTINGGCLDSTRADLVNANNNAQTWNTNFAFVGSQNLNLGTGSVTMNANCTLTVSNKTLTVGGAISGPSYSLTKAGNGTLVLSGANTYSNTLVTAGKLQIAQATLATNSTVSVASGAVLQLDFATTNQVAALVLDGVSQPNGVYGSSTPGGYLAGSGYLQVVAVAPAPPTLLSVSPNPVTGSSYPVTLSLTGNGFDPACLVVLTNPALSGTTYTPVVRNGNTNLLVRAVLGTSAGSWTATVVNPGPAASAPVGFAVRVPASVEITKSSINSAGSGKVVLNGTGGTPGYSYAVVSATNLLPPVVWLPVVTNTFDASGNFAYTNTANSALPQLFLRIEQ